MGRKRVSSPSHQHFWANCDGWDPSPVESAEGGKSITGSRAVPGKAWFHNFRPAQGPPEGRCCPPSKVLQDPGMVGEEIEIMWQLGIIEASTTEWCSPIVWVPKKDGSLRLCIDFSYLNTVSKFESYPIPRIDELLKKELESPSSSPPLAWARGSGSWPCQLKPRSWQHLKHPMACFSSRGCLLAAMSTPHEPSFEEGSTVCSGQLGLCGHL